MAEDEKDIRHDDTARPDTTGTPAMMKKVFGIFMLLIYFGMGGLTIGGYFDILFGSWHWMRWALGSLFIFYGIWRAYRYFTGRN